MKKSTQKTTGFFPILKTGKHKDNRGREHNFDTVKLDKIAALYNQIGSERKEAPAVIGHPKTDSPAYGWIAELKRIGNKLFAKAKDVVPAFASQVKQNMYKYVSPSLRSDGSLRHVAFLGGTPPAIAGLGEVTPAFANFADDEEFDSFSFDFAEMESSGIAYVAEQLKKALTYLVDNKSDFSEEEKESGVEESDVEEEEEELRVDELGVDESELEEEETESGDESPVQEESTITPNIKEKNMLKKLKQKEGEKSLEKENSPPGTQEVQEEGEPKKPAAEFSESDKDKEIASLKKRLEVLEADSAKRETMSVTEFTEGLVKQGKLLPKLKPGFIRLIQRLDNTEAFNFAEDDAEKPDEKTIRQAFYDFCEEALTVQVPLTKIKRGKGRADANDDDPDDFSEADPEQRELDLKVKARMKKDSIDYQTALNRERGK